MHYNGCMSSSPHQFGPHAAHLPAAPIQRRAHTRRPHLNLAEYDARVKGEDELRAALVKLQAAKAKLEVDPENADFQKAVRLVEIDVQSTTQMARLLKSPNVDAILACPLLHRSLLPLSPLAAMNKRPLAARERGKAARLTKT
jgi:hypothetical protein